MTESAIAIKPLPTGTRSAAVPGWDTYARELDLAVRTAAGQSARSIQPKPAHRFSKLSVLIAVYNEEVTLWPCVQAVLAARLPRGMQREVVLVDDGSTDGSWDIALRL